MTGAAVAILQNVLVMLALGYCYALLAKTGIPRPPARIQIASGVLFGVSAIAGMLVPFEIEPGVFIDARTIPIILASSFCGIWASPVAGLIAGAYRYSLGGIGIFAGVGAVILATIQGLVLAWWWRNRSDGVRFIDLVSAGILAAILGVVSIFLIPDTDIRIRVLNQLAGPILIFYPIATILLGSLLVHANRMDARRVKMELDIYKRNAELERFNALLNVEIVERERLEKELVAAEKMKAVGRVTGGIAHHFNNSLQIIQGNLDILSVMINQNSIDRDRSSELVERAAASGWQAADLIKKLLIFSHGQLLSPTAIGANDVVSEIAERLRNTIASNISVSTDLADGLPDIVIDRTVLGEALVALAENARVAMDGGGTLTLKTGQVRLRHEDTGGEINLPDGDYVVLTVADDGCGAAPEIADRAFEPFFTTSDFGERAGLGLSMVYGLARQSDGTAVIESVVGKGTSVKIYLPAAKRPSPEATPGGGSDRKN